MAGVLQLDAIVEGPDAVLGRPTSGPIHPHEIARRHLSPVVFCLVQRYFWE